MNLLSLLICFCMEHCSTKPQEKFGCGVHWSWWVSLSNSYLWEEWHGWQGSNITEWSFASFETKCNQIHLIVFNCLLSLLHFVTWCSQSCTILFCSITRKIVMGSVIYQHNKFGITLIMYGFSNLISGKWILGHCFYCWWNIEWLGLVI